MYRLQDGITQTTPARIPHGKFDDFESAKETLLSFLRWVYSRETEVSEVRGAQRNEAGEFVPITYLSSPGWTEREISEAQNTIAAVEKMTKNEFDELRVFQQGEGDAVAFSAIRPRVLGSSVTLMGKGYVRPEGGWPK
jgi:hypothetical protein